MKNVNLVVEKLMADGFLSENNVANAKAILESNFTEVVESAEAIHTAEKDKELQAQAIKEAKELAESDVEMGEVEDQFVQAEVIDSAVSLLEEDDALMQKADAYLVATVTETAMALVEAGLVDNADLKAVTLLLNTLWHTESEEN